MCLCVSVMDMKKCGMQPSTLSTDRQLELEVTMPGSSRAVRGCKSRSRFSSINVQSARERLNPQATSAPGPVIVAQGSATPEAGCTLTNSCTDDDIDIRSVDIDGAVQSVIPSGAFSAARSRPPTHGVDSMGLRHVAPHLLATSPLTVQHAGV